MSQPNKDQRSPEDIDFKVKANPKAFHKFNGKFQRVLRDHEDDFNILSISMQDHFDTTKQVALN